MKKVLINGFLYFVEGCKLYDENKTSFTYTWFLTENEKRQLYNCLYYDADREHVERYVDNTKVERE
jgi:hypothetical protein